MRRQSHQSKASVAGSFSFGLATNIGPFLIFLGRATGNITITGTYNIAAKLCVPANGLKKHYLQIATHGGGYDQRYWDVRIDPSQYSYVDAVLDAGYSILTYDRLGTGKSDKPDAYTVVQLPAGLQVLRAITEIARQGQLGKYAVNASSVPLQEFEKFIHVGHSEGSFITVGLVSFYGNLTDAVVSTGFIPPTMMSPAAAAINDFQYAPEDNPQLFGEFSSGYVVAGTPNAVQAGFLSDRRNHTVGLGGFEPRLKELAYETRQPNAITELLSIGAFTSSYVPAEEFTGPIQFMSGEFDYLTCGGDCRGLANQTSLDILFPKASNMDVHLQPGTGHGLALHRGANVGYKVILDWLAKNGL